MTIYIDPPRWPAHGTLFSHMVSDESLAELHSFAQSLDISPRAFDLDHYDVPAQRYDQAVAAGAVPVDGKALVRALMSSGLRIPARRRSDRLSATLMHRWTRHFPGMKPIGEELLTRWSEPHRHYHDLTHLLSVLEAVDQLVDSVHHPAVVAAAWFHDAVYQCRPGEDEEQSAQLARKRLSKAGWNHSQVQRVADLILVTQHHRPWPQDAEARALVDADLSILGSPEIQYDQYRAAIRAEYAHVPRAEFVRGRLRILSELGRTPRLFTTATGIHLWEEPARRNLAREISELQRESERYS